MRIPLYKNPEPAPGGNAEDFFAPYLDTFLLDGAKIQAGAVLVLPGGGYTHYGRHEGDPVAKAFNELGFHAFTLMYRVKPYGYPAPQMDAVRAIRIIRANAAKWGIDPEKIAICGFSAGGHLAACNGLFAEKYDPVEGDEADNVDGRANAMILGYGVLSVNLTYTVPGYQLTANTPYRDENGNDIEFADAINDLTPPAYVWHMATDGVVPAECSVQFARAMWAKEKLCELHIFSQGPHGRGLGMGFPDARTWSREAAVFLESRCGFKRAVYY